MCGGGTGVQLPSAKERNEQGLPVSEGGLMHSWEHGCWSPDKGPIPLNGNSDSDGEGAAVYLSAEEGPSEPSSPLNTGLPFLGLAWHLGTHSKTHRTLLLGQAERCGEWPFNAA